MLFDIFYDEKEYLAQADAGAAAVLIREAVAGELARLAVTPVGELVNDRYARYRELGAWSAVEVPPTPTPRQSIADRIRELRAIIAARRDESRDAARTTDR